MSQAMTSLDAIAARAREAMAFAGRAASGHRIADHAYEMIVGDRYAAPALADDVLALVKRVRELEAELNPRWVADTLYIGRWPVATLQELPDAVWSHPVYAAVNILGGQAAPCAREKQDARDAALLDADIKDSLHAPTVERAVREALGRKQTQEYEMETSEFDCGLSDEDRDAVFDLRIDIGRMIERIEKLPRHRSLSLAITKLEEARHWLRDRTAKPI